MPTAEIAKQIKEAKENVIVIYAFNATGKTRLSVEYKNLTKDNDTGVHAGVYYNAYSEDLFYWDNDEIHQGANKKLNIIPSSLNKLHTLITEDNIKEKLIPFNPSFNFFFNSYDSTPDYESVTFFNDGDEKQAIKISRGEERIFILCFFLALFEVEGWADEQNLHFFIDDPVSSLDDYNIFITASLIFDLIEKHFTSRKIIVTTHHFNFFSILCDWLSRGEKSEKFKEKKIADSEVEHGQPVIKKEIIENRYKFFFLEKNLNNHKLVSRKKGTQLHHLVLFQLLREARDNNELCIYHFVLLRQLLEIFSSFLGYGRFGAVLNKIDLKENKIPDVINALSHERIYFPKTTLMNENERQMFNNVFEGLEKIFPFGE